MDTESAWHALTGEHGPAPKEERMKGNFNTPLESAFEHAFWLGFRHSEWVKNRKTEIKKNEVVYVWADTIDNAVNDCMKLASEVCEKCATDLRAVYRDAYFAALGGLAGIDGLADVETVYHAQQCALETVRQWPAMMAELEQEIAK